MKQWLTLFTKANAERKVAYSLQERGYETFLPEITTRKARSQTREPLFPCYLFASVDLEIEELSGLQWTPGLRRIVAFEGALATVPENAMDALRRRQRELNMRTAKRSESCAFQQGDTVRVIGGPFQDMLAVFDKPLSSGDRVQVLLELLGRWSRVKIDANELAAASPTSQAATQRRPRRTRGRGRYIK